MYQSDGKKEPVLCIYAILVTFALEVDFPWERDLNNFAGKSSANLLNLGKLRIS